jgi:hypothetical protein
MLPDGMTREELKEFFEARGIVETQLDIMDEITNTNRLIQACEKKVDEFGKIRLYNLERNWGEMLRRTEEVEHDVEDLGDKVSELDNFAFGKCESSLKKLRLSLMEAKCETLEKTSGKAYRTREEKHYLIGKLEAINMVLTMVDKLEGKYTEAEDDSQN